MTEKLKSWLLNDQIFYGIMVILVAISSFVLGRLSVDSGNTAKPTIQMIEPITLTATAPLAKSIEAPQKTGNNTDTPNQLVASKNGKRYYLKSCSGAKRIKPENLVSFDSRESAEAAGYTKAANCSGL
jgi:hypothetical protein